MNLDHSLKSQVILSLREQIKDTLSCHLTSTFLKYFTTFLNKINARNVWSAVMTSGAYYACNRSSSLNAFWFDLWPAYATFLLAFSQFIKLFLPSFMFTISSSQVLFRFPTLKVSLADNSVFQVMQIGWNKTLGHSFSPWKVLWAWTRAESSQKMVLPLFSSFSSCSRANQNLKAAKPPSLLNLQSRGEKKSSSLFP